MCWAPNEDSVVLVQFQVLDLKKLHWSLKTDLHSFGKQQSARAVGTHNNGKPFFKLTALKKYVLGYQGCSL